MSKCNWDFLKMKQGSHVGCFSRGPKEQLEVLLPFLFAGLQRNEKCVCLLSEETKKELLSSLLGVGLDAVKCSGWGQFLFLNPENSYLKNGGFVPEEMIKVIADIERLAMKSGFNGVRIAGEARIFNAGFPGTERFIEYEAKVNDFFRKSRTSALCLYDETVMNRDILRDAIYTHPQVVIYGSQFDNQYYVPPEILFSGDEKRDSRTYDGLREELLTK